MELRCCEPKAMGEGVRKRCCRRQVLPSSVLISPVGVCFAAEVVAANPESGLCENHTEQSMPNHPSSAVKQPTLRIRGLLDK